MVYLKIDDKSPEAKAFLKLIKLMTFIEIMDKKEIPNEETILALKDAQDGKVNSYKSSKDFFTKIKKRKNE